MDDAVGVVDYRGAGAGVGVGFGFDDATRSLQQARFPGPSST